MIDVPIVIDKESFQEAWIAAASHLRANSWTTRNLVVQIADPTAIDDTLHERLADFAKDAKTLSPKQVAYTIFPHGLYEKCESADKLFAAYNRKPGGMCSRLLKKSSSKWGTYFQRLTDYKTVNGPVNQLKQAIDAISSDKENGNRTCTSAFCMTIQQPGGETRRRLGGPCLNYIAVQLEAGPPQSLGLLCVYRNHDFVERAYGNYWGLCNLLLFMAEQVDAVPGPLTCISSRAYVDKKKTDLKSLLDELT